jgi:hypothetical protein
MIGTPGNKDLICPSSRYEGLHNNTPSGMRIRIRIVFASWIRIQIRIGVKSWIRIRITFKIQKLYRLKQEPWRAMVAHNEGLVSKWSPGVSIDQ